MCGGEIERTANYVLDNGSPAERLRDPRNVSDPATSSHSDSDVCR